MTISTNIKEKRSFSLQNFVCHFESNHALKNGKWRSLYPKDGTDMSVKDFLALIAETYDLDDGVSSDLVLTYHNHSRNRATGKLKKMQ